MKLKKLSKNFYRKYDKKNYPNIIRKIDRPYIILTIKLDRNIYGIPVKSNIKHKSSFLFKDSERKKKGEKPGLDYKGTVIINEENLINNDEEVTIDLKEMKYLITNRNRIYESFSKYIKDYLKYVKNPIIKLYESPRYAYTSLEYYWKELGIIVEDEYKWKLFIKNCYNLYLFIKYISSDTNTKLNDFVAKSVHKDIICVYFKNKVIIEGIKIDRISEYLKIQSYMDSKSEIHHKYIKTDKFYETLGIINKLKVN